MTQITPSARINPNSRVARFPSVAAFNVGSTDIFLKDSIPDGAAAFQRLRLLLSAATKII